MQKAAPAARPAPRAALRSWTPDGARAPIERFIGEVSELTSPLFVVPADRIAVFDHDGTLWSEQPHSFQVLFALDFALTELGRAEGDALPDWASRPWAEKLAKRGRTALSELTPEDLGELLSASQADVTPEDYSARVRSWLELAQHPRFERRYTELSFQPMLELLAVLREHGFSTYIVCGAEAAFMRVFANVVYGVPPERVIGSTRSLHYELEEGVGILRFLAPLESLNDGAEKPKSIQSHIGKRPILAIGNSDGDREMLQFSTLGRPGTLGVLVRHDDEVREWAYDRAANIGKLDVALDEAEAAGWLVVSMKHDFSRIYPFESAPAGP